MIKEVEDILKFWLDKGVYGFRCDVINNIYKSSLENDNKLKLYAKGEKYYCNQEGMFKVLKRIREEVLDKYDTFLVGETGNISKEVGNRLLDERCLDMFFEFDHIYADKSRLIPVFKRKFSAKRLMSSLFKWQENVPYIANYLENHDQLRSVSRYGDENEYYLESAKLLCVLLLTLKGTPFIYQGEEFGTLNYKSLSKEDTNDCAAHAAFDTIKKTIHCSDKKAWKMVDETINRDHARAPIARNEDINGGFNEGHDTWLKINPRYKEINLEKSIKSDDSIVSFYKKMIHFRNESEVLKEGEFIRGILSNSLNTFYRTYNGKTYMIVLNFKKKTIKFSNPLITKCILSNYEKITSYEVLPPYFAGIFEVE